MIFFVAIPLVTGIVNYVMPLQIGARDVAFPFLNSLSLWLTVAGALLVMVSLFVGEFSRAGWLNYVPVANLANSPDTGPDYYLWALQIAGVGTTLSANALAMHCMRANLEQVMTQAAYDHMLPLAKRLADGFRGLIAKHDLKWSVTELGARSEFQFCPVSPRTGAEAEAAFHDELQMALHLYLINRGILITPFHNMTLCCPATSADDVDRLIATLDQALTELLAIPGARI